MLAQAVSSASPDIPVAWRTGTAICAGGEGKGNRMTHLGKKATPTNDIGEVDISALIAAVPHLRAFARLLRGDPARADDLVQEVIVHARATTRHSLPGKNLKLWLFSLAHHLHYRDPPKAGARHDPLVGAGTRGVPGVSCQEACCTSHGFSLAFSRLRDEQREALILIEAADLTYREAAGVCNCPIDTIKSRVSRARGRLLQTQLVGAA
jgi:RNA polymerase sigma-70 factor (ECF subfamily)